MQNNKQKRKAQEVAAATATPVESSTITTPRVDHIRDIGMTAEEFWKTVWQNLGRWIALMQEVWGYAPGFVVKSEGHIMCTVDFDLKNLPHNGRRFFVNPDNVSTLSPEEIARHTATEIYHHKAICAECGDGSATIQERLKKGINTPPDKLEKLLYPKLAAEMDKRCAATFVKPKVRRSSPKKRKGKTHGKQTR